MSTRIKKICGAFFLLGILVVGALGVFEYQTRPVQIQGETVVFEVREGESSRDIITNLRKENLIRSQFFTSIRMKTMGNVRFYVGTYNLRNSWSTHDLLSHMSNLDNVNGANEVRVLLREGSWAKDMAKAIGENTNVSAEELLNLWNDPVAVQALVDEYDHLPQDIMKNEHAIVLLEGYLYPDTYNFFKETSAADITKKIMDNGLLKFRDVQDYVEESELSHHELITLASIVEYEAHKIDDMRLIAGVFINRLNIGMKLQSSVTVCYSLYEFNDWKDCEAASNNQIDSPYNTYRYEGLPPGPILNPSNQAIEATANYAASDYLFFLADVYGDGTVYFAETYEQHQIYKEKYLGGPR